MVSSAGLVLLRKLVKLISMRNFTLLVLDRCGLLIACTSLSTLWFFDCERASSRIIDTGGRDGAPVVFNNACLFFSGPCRCCHEVSTFITRSHRHCWMVHRNSITGHCLSGPDIRLDVNKADDSIVVNEALHCVRRSSRSLSMDEKWFKMCCCTLLRLRGLVESRKKSFCSTDNVFTLGDWFGLVNRRWQPILYGHDINTVLPDTSKADHHLEDRITYRIAPGLQ